MTVRRPSVGGIPCTMGALRLFVLERDKVCLGFALSLVVDPPARLAGHQCLDRWGRHHRPDDLDRLTLEHVPTVHAVTDVRRDNERHCVTLCHMLNVGGPPRELRDWMRLYLRARYPTCTPEES